MWLVTTISCVVSVSNTTLGRGYQHLCWPFRVLHGLYPGLGVGLGICQTSVFFRDGSSFNALLCWKVGAAPNWFSPTSLNCDKDSAREAEAVGKEYGDTLEYSSERSLLLEIWARFGVFHFCASCLQRGLSKIGLSEHKDSRDTAAMFRPVREAKLCQVNSNYFWTIS